MAQRAVAWQNGFTVDIGKRANIETVVRFKTSN